MNIILKTSRLILTEITLEHLHEMYEMYTNPKVHQYTGEPMMTSIQQMAEAIEWRIKNYSKFGYGRWATFLKDQNTFIGWAGLAYLPEFNEIDLGYRFLPQFWGYGYATEASKAILHYGFERLNLEKIIAIAMKENKASIRVMEKVGMQFDKYAPYDPGGEDVIWYQSNPLLFRNFMASKTE